MALLRFYVEISVDVCRDNICEISIVALFVVVNIWKWPNTIQNKDMNTKRYMNTWKTKNFRSSYE